jgi:hypothetical protein
LALSAAYVGLYNKIPYGFGISLPDLDIPADNAGIPILVLGGGSSVARLGNYLHSSSLYVKLTESQSSN